MITSYIQELLATNNRVIIPNYGAFLVRATSKGKDSNNLEEKLSDVYFSPFLKFNDELLERFIIKKEGITKDLASVKIKDFIEEIKLKLTDDSVYDIPKFGQFTMDKQGKVAFTPIVNESGIKDTESEKPKETTKKETKKTSTKTGKEPVKKVTAKAKSAKSTEKEIAPEIKQEELIIKEEVKQTIKTEEKPIMPEIKTPFSTSKAEKEQTTVKKASSVNKGLVWSIAIGLPLAAIFIWALLNFDTVNKILKKEKKQETKIEKIVTEKNINENTEVTEPESPITENTEQAIDASTTQEPIKSVEIQKKYYIIAGSFKNQKYADNYQKSLIEKGFPAERLGERNGMYAVSYSSFTDKTQALAEYKIITREKGLTAWILYF
ncbi:MAG: SPOR domain-containing protein [Bacteroidales bacterium]